MFITNEDEHLVTCASEGLVKIWDFQTKEIVKVIRPPNDKPSMELDVYSITPLPQSGPTKFVICNRSNTLYLVNLEGSLIKTF